MNLEENSMILGSIPSTGGGLRKTYLESEILLIYATQIEKIFDDKTHTYFYNKKTNKYFFAKKETEKNEDINECEIIGVLPYGPIRIDSFNAGYFNFFIEVIDKKVLYSHLIDERYNLKEEKGLKL